MTTCNWKVYRNPQCLYTVCNPVKRVAQPSPSLSGGGDCFNCAALAIIQKYLPGGVQAPSLKTLWEEVWQGQVLGPESRGPSRLEDRTRFWKALSDWGEVQYQAVVDAPLSIPDPQSERADGPNLFQEDTFSKRCRVYLEAGYIGYCAVQFERRSDVIRYKDYAPLEGTDHIVVLDGFREMYRSAGRCLGDGPWYAGSYFNEVHIVCSTAREDYWIGTREFIKEHGGYQIVWVRPDGRVEPQYFPEVQAGRCGNGHRKT